MTGASKIPPHIARELGRHLKPRSKGPGGSSAGKGQKDTGKLYTFLGCTAFIGITASFPYVGMAWIGRLTDKDEVRRMFLYCLKQLLWPSMFRSSQLYLIRLAGINWFPNSERSLQ